VCAQYDLDNDGRIDETELRNAFRYGYTLVTPQLGAGALVPCSLEAFAFCAPHNACAIISCARAAVSYFSVAYIDRGMGASLSQEQFDDLLGLMDVDR
jgi:Ca2+-binding EF-hand superfamily protein